MSKVSKILFISILLLLALQVQVLCEQVFGSVTKTAKDTIVAEFNVRVKNKSMMVILTGESQSVSGVAISEKCTGDGPYNVVGKLYFATNGNEIVAGKKVYIDPSNAIGVPKNPSPPAAAGMIAQPTSKSRSVYNDLKLYYYAAGQNVGYGALGVGYERTLRLTPGLGLQLDGGVTGFGTVNTKNPDEIDTSQMIKSLNGRLNMDFGRGVGVFSAYRWSEGRGEEDNWDRVAENLKGKRFAAASNQDEGDVVLQGLEYGLTLRPVDSFSLSLGYLPKLRADYGSLGVRDEPGYSAELRFGTRYGAVRLRGISSDNYWLADLGVTIK